MPENFKLFPRTIPFNFRMIEVLRNVENKYALPGA